MKKYKYSISRVCERCGAVVINHSNNRGIFAKMKHYKKVGLRRYCKRCACTINATGVILSKETRLKMSIAHKGLNNRLNGWRNALSEVKIIICTERRCLKKLERRFDYLF